MRIAATDVEIPNPSEGTLLATRRIRAERHAGR